MTWQNIVSLLGGLALFLFGMKQLSDGLESVAGARLRTKLEALTAHPLAGIAMGAAVTAAIQSSTATTVMVVGFLSARLLRLEQAVYLIMGANIGTTVTSLITGLRVDWLGPAALTVGVAWVLFGKRRSRPVGAAVAGFGMLLTGMHTMATAMAPLAQDEAFLAAMTRFRHPLTGVLAGMLMTAVLQSSAAAVGIVQALMAGGGVGLGSVIFMLFGQNIGTCVTAMLASLRANRAGRRAAWLHLLFNLLGTGLFVAVCTLFPYVTWIESLTDLPALQVSLAHMFFNLGATAVLAPFGKGLVRLTHWLVLGEDPPVEECRLHYLNPAALANPPFAVTQVKREIERMARLARENLRLAADALLSPDEEALKQVARHEEVINFLNHEITDHLIRIHALELSEEDSRAVGGMFHIVNDWERVGDHADNVREQAEQVRDGVTLSAAAQEEVRALCAAVDEMLAGAMDAFARGRQGLTEEEVRELLAREEAVDEQVLLLRDRHVRRLSEGGCTARAGMVYVDLLTDLERVADHATNVLYAAYGEPFPRL